jgi:hypothetical protein
MHLYTYNRWQLAELTERLREFRAAGGSNQKTLRAKVLGGFRSLWNSTSSLAVFYVEQVALNRHVSPLPQLLPLCLKTQQMSRLNRTAPRIGPGKTNEQQIEPLARQIRGIEKRISHAKLAVRRALCNPALRPVLRLVHDSRQGIPRDSRWYTVGTPGGRPLQIEEQQKWDSK